MTGVIKATALVGIIILAIAGAAYYVIGIIALSCIALTAEIWDQLNR